jgi:glycosyltransferase involved in cell wall biosynthesis
MPEPDLSFAVPVKDGLGHLGETLDQITAFAQELGRSYELIVVDDGSRDGTRELLEMRAAADPHLRVLHHEGNRGKGAALKTAAASSRGALLISLDADASYDLATAREGIRALEGGADAAIGDRRDPRSQFVLHPRQFAYIGLRHAIGWVFNRLARLLTGIRVEDVQCGFKCYRGELARRVFPQVEDDRFAFDLELIALLQQEGCAIAELPVVYTDRDQPTTVRFLHDGALMLRRMLRISAKLRRRRRSGAFDDPDRADYQDLARRAGNPVQRFWHAQKWPLVDRTLALAGSRLRVLDVGAGSSEVARRACERGDRAIAVDVSLASLHFLRKRVKGTEAESLRCVGASILDLPFASQRFDRVAVLEVIEHLPAESTARYLAELRRVLAPEGRLLVTTPNYRSYWPLLEWLIDRFGGAAEMGGVQHISRFHARSLRRALHAAGFRVLELGSVYHVSPFVAPVAQGVAQRLFDWELRRGGHLGPILFAVAEPGDA